MRAMAKLIEELYELFARDQRPEEFTNYQHCEECDDHNNTLKRYERRTLPVSVVTNPAWDAFCFITPEGYRYYYPRLCELAYGRGTDYFLDQFLFHLENRRHLLSAEEKIKTVELLLDLATVLADEIERYITKPDLDRVSEELCE